MTRQIIPLTLSPRQHRAQLINHLIPGIVLILAGLDALSGAGEAHGFFPWLNIIVGSVAAGTILYELKYSHHSHAAVINWAEIAAGAVIFLEGYNHFHPHKIFQPGLLYMLLAVFIIVRGIYHTRFPTVRRLTIDETGFQLRTSPFHFLAASWKEIETIRMDGNKLIVGIHGGDQRTISMRRVGNRNAVVDALQGRHAELTSAGEKPIIS